MRRLVLFGLLLLLGAPLAQAADNCAQRYCLRLPLVSVGGPDSGSGPEPSTTASTTGTTIATATTPAANPTTPDSPTTPAASPTTPAASPTTPANPTTPAASPTTPANPTTPAASPTTPANPTTPTASTTTPAIPTQPTVTTTPTTTVPQLTSIQWLTETKNIWPMYGNTEAQAAVINNKLYLFGGYDTTWRDGNNQVICCRPTERAYYFDPLTNTWMTIKDLPFENNGGMTHAGIATDGTYIYLAGGYISNASRSGQVFGTKQAWRYDPAGDGGGTYTPLPDLPLDRAAGQLAVITGPLGLELHYIGGTNKQRTVDVGDHWVLDLDTPGAQWLTRAALPNPRHHAAAITYKGKIYYVGGEHDHDGELYAQDDVHAYDPFSDQWELVTDLPYPKPSGNPVEQEQSKGRNHHGFTTLVVGDLMLLVGGQTRHRMSTEWVNAYNFESGTWMRFSNLPRRTHSAVAGVLRDSSGQPFIFFTTGESRRDTYLGTLVFE